MFRTDVTTAVGTRPTPAAAGTPGFFSNGNPATGVPATVVDADWLNGFQEEIISVLTAANIAPVKGAVAQLWQAILACHQMTDTGAVNACVANPSPAVAALVGGMRVDLVVGTTNTGAATFNLSGLGAISVVRPDGSPLQPGDLTAGQSVPLIYSGAVWRLVYFPARIRLTGPLSLFVNVSSGSDSNNGLSSGAAFATLNKAYSWLQQNVDVGGQIVTINCVGTTLAPLNASGPVLGTAGPGSIVFLGNTGSPGNVQVNASNAAAFTAVNGAQFTVKGFQISASGSGQSGIFASGGGSIIAFNNMIFASVALAHISASNGGQVITQTGATYTVTVGGANHVLATVGALISLSGATVTLTGTPAFGVAFAGASDNGDILANGTVFSGAATGNRYSAQLNGVIDTNGGGASFLPGNATGTTATGGQYN